MCEIAKETVDLDNRYNKLTPIDNADMGEYKTMLDFAMKEEDLQNIAITGAYGAGKSSILKTYEKTREDKSFLHISLAIFMSDEIGEHEVKSSRNGNDNVYPESPSLQQEAIIEGKILNQLLHKIDYKKIPFTKFKVKKDISPKTPFFYTGILMAFVFSILGLVFFDSLLPFLSEKNINWPKYIFIVVFLLSTIGIICFFVKLFQYNRSISKLTIQGNSVEILQDYDGSIFDRNLNEVLYLFEHVDVDAIVFEDLDRYNTNQIFIKLREINKLLNEKAKGTPIKFFYVLRDDVFTTTDRTKFFDFIIPIVTVLDIYNARDELTTQLADKDFSPVFLRGIAFYIQEMRLLYNIVNEYNIYFDKVESKKGEEYQNKEKLLAMVTYKNIFPRDFSDLQKNQGYVATLFAAYKKIAQENLDKQLEKINETIQKKSYYKMDVHASTVPITIVHHSGITPSLMEKSLLFVRFIIMFLELMTMEQHQLLGRFQRTFESF